MISNFRQLALASSFIAPFFLTACLPNPTADDPEPRTELQTETNGDIADTGDSNEETVVGYCPAIYAPVCAELRVQCVTSPCTPIQRIFSSACEAERFEYTVISQGHCDNT